MVETIQEIPESRLVALLKSGSPEAFELLVARFGRLLYAVSFRIVRNAQDAEDAVQETFLSAFQSIQNFREESSLNTWLYRIVCNHSLRKVQQQSRRRDLPIEPFLPHFERGQHTEKILDWSHVPESSLRGKELSEFFERCIDELPEDLRIPYILKDVEKLSEERVCEILGVTKFTMKNRVHRARLVIRKRVEDEFFRAPAPRAAV